ncbi:MAG: S24/S26 family peptidase [Bacteroides sp.]
MQRITVPNELLLPEVERMLVSGTSVTLRVKGNSMQPFIEGDRDSVVLVPPARLQKGDIVLARLAGCRYVIHRIIRLQGEEVTLRGDGNLLRGEHCLAADISGKVTKIVRNGKYIEADSAAENRKAALWETALPVRRYLLAVYRLLR